MADPIIIPVQEGHWGKWEKPVVIPDGYFISGMQVRFESWNHEQDDTALNGLKLLCTSLYNPDDVQTVVAHEGFWGTWRKPVTVPNECYVIGLATRIESKQGSNGDDTALNGLKMLYRHRVTMQVNPLMLESGIWGQWAGEASVPEDSLMCGVQIRMEQPQAPGKDDTAMNGINILSRPIPALQLVGTAFKQNYHK